MRISVFQALTLLAKKYRFSNNQDTYKEIKELYLSGVTSFEHQKLLTRLLQDELLQGYEVSDNWDVIDQDPVRRYFESHLAHETLLIAIDKLPLVVLMQHSQALMWMIYHCCSYEGAAIISRVVGPNPEVTSDDTTGAEFVEAMRSLKKEGSYPSFSPEGKPEVGRERKHKLTKIVASFYIGLVFILYSRIRPPFEGSFSGDDSPFLFEHRGRINRLDSLEEQQLRTHALGIMRSYMPLSADDVLFNEEKASYGRPCERNTYAPQHGVIHDNFSTKVNPYVASISGTMLTQVRAIAFLLEHNSLAFQGMQAALLKEYIRALIGFFLYFSGGHSLKEFAGVFELNEIQSHPLFKGINLNSLFYTDNEEAFERAVTNTIEYNQVILRKKKIGLELISVAPKFKIAEAVKEQESIKLTKKDAVSALNKQAFFLLNCMRLCALKLLVEGGKAKQEFILSVNLLYRLFKWQQKIQSSSSMDHLELSVDEARNFQRKAASLVPQRSSSDGLVFFAVMAQKNALRPLTRSPRVSNLLNTLG